VKISNTFSCTSTYFKTGIGTICDRGPTRSHLLFDGLHSEGCINTNRSISGNTPSVRPSGWLQSAMEMGGQSSIAGNPSQKRHVRAMDASV